MFHVVIITQAKYYVNCTGFAYRFRVYSYLYVLFVFKTFTKYCYLHMFDIVYIVFFSITQILLHTWCGGKLLRWFSFFTPRKSTFPETCVQD